MKIQGLKKRLVGILSLSVMLTFMLGLFKGFPVMAADAAVPESNIVKEYAVLDADYLYENLEKDYQISVSLANWSYIDYELKNDGFDFIRFKMLNKDGNKHNDPYIGLNINGEYSADIYKYVTVIARTDENPSKGVTRGGARFQVFFDTVEEGGYDEKKSASVKYAALCGYQVLTYDFSQNEQWTGGINRLRLDVYGGGEYGEGDYCDVAAIILNKNANAVYDSAYEMLSKIYTPEQVLSDFKEEEAECFVAGGAASATTVSVNDGILRYDAQPDYQDPYAGFYYKDLMDMRGVAQEDRLTTADFKYTVFRYRTSKSISGGTNMQLFCFAGENYKPFQVNGTFLHPNTSYKATPNNNWQSMIVQMDGVKASASGWAGDFNGFRVDWCGSAAEGEYMEISDIMFFADENKARSLSDALNTLKLEIPVRTVTHDGSYFAIPESDSYSFVWANEINEGIVDSANATHSYQVGDGLPAVRLEVTEESEAPFVDLDTAAYNADKYKYVNILVKTNNTSNPAFSLYFVDENNEYDPDHLSITRYASLSGWQVLTFNFSELSSWSGELDRFRLEFFCGGSSYTPGMSCDIAAMSFCADEEAVYDSASVMLAKAYNAVQILTDFDAEDVEYFQLNNKEGNTSLKAVNGNLIYTATGSSDPQKTVKYEEYAKYKGLKPVTTDVFQYTFIRYRGMGYAKSSMELYFMTGDAKDLWDMARYDYVDENGVRKWDIHKTIAKYNVGSDWGNVVLNMAASDGQENNTKLYNGWHREDGNTRFQGFRFDWCLSGVTGSYLEVSDFIFFTDKVTAGNYAKALGLMSIPGSFTEGGSDPGDGGDDFPFDEETTSDSSGQDTDLPEYPDGGETGEEIPTYPGDDKPPVEDGSDGEDESDDTEEEIDSSDDTDETEEEGSSGNGGVDIPPAGDVGNPETEPAPADKGSEVPFKIACISMAGLSVASIVTIVYLKIKIKSENQ